MKKGSVILLFFCLSLLQGYAFTEKNLLQKSIEEVNVKEVLIKNQAWVPYPDYNDRDGWDRLTGSFKSDYIARGEQALDYNWIVIRATDYLDFERTGARTTMESPYGRNNQAIIDLFMAELTEGKGRFIDQLINGVYFSCEMTSWSIAAHQVRQSNRRSLPLKDEHLIELASGDMGSVFSWIYYFFQEEFNKVDPTISHRLRHELEERMLKPFLEKEFWWMGFNYQPGMIINNWNVWCNFNVLQSFLLLENDEQRLTDAVIRTMQSVDQFINYSKEDGACEEGPSYWGHAAGKMYDYLQLLHDASDGKISIFEIPMIKDMGEYISRSYVGNGWVVNFADASARLSLDPHLIFRYGKAVHSDEMMGFARYLSENRNSTTAPMYGRDIFRTFQSLLYQEEFLENRLPYSTPRNTWYPETEFCYMKSEGGLFFASKGGFNNESHNHNDVGTFSLYINETPVFIDVGVGTYTRQTFSGERYTIWTMQSDYHNLPRVNGHSQEHGQHYRSKNATYNPRKQTFSLDISDAYPETASLNNWNREYRLKKNELVIEDRYSLKDPEENNRVYFLTWGNVEHAGKGVIQVEVMGQKAELRFNENQLTPTIEALELDDRRLKNVWGETIYRIQLEEKSIQPKGRLQYSIIKK